MKKNQLFILIFLSSFFSKAQILTSQNFDTSLGWTYNSVVNGQTGVTEAGWIRQTLGVNPVCSPSSGVGMACFVGHNVLGNTLAGLYPPALTFSGLNYRVRFKMFRITTNTINSNEIKVYINSTNSLTGATLLGTFKPYISELPTVPESGWYECYVNLPSGTTGNKNVFFVAKTNVGFGDNVYIDEVYIEQSPLVDACLDTFIMNSNVLAGSKSITGRISNRGVTSINSITINWQENNGVIYSQNLTGLNITSGQTYNYTHSTNWNATPQQSEMKVWLSNINGGVTDNYLANNQIIRPINIYSSYFIQNVVYEELTGTWCGYCPKGIVALKDMYHYNTDGTFIGIAVHKGFSSDPMSLQSYVTGLDSYSTATPDGVFNRNNNEIIYPNYSAVNQNYQINKSKIPVAKINIVNNTWNSTTRQITIDTETKFSMNLHNINYNIAVVVLEDNVTGLGSGYSQLNYYANNTDVIDWEGINWRNLPNSVSYTTMHYNHVARALLGGFGGLSGAVPNTVVFETPYNQSFNYSLPNYYNSSNISLVALLIDNSTGQIVNASKTSLSTLNKSVFNKNIFKFYPNPSTSIVNFETYDKKVVIELFDIVGEIVYKGSISNNSNIDFSFLQKGVYFIKATNDLGSDVQKLILE